MTAFQVLAQAKHDLAEHYSYLYDESPPAAERFIVSAGCTFAWLAEFPHAGTPWSKGRHQGRLRTWSIEDFHRHIVFYRVVGSRIEVVRVIHGAQDFRRLKLK